MKRVMYGLKRKGTDDLLGFYTCSNDGADFCVSTRYELSPNEGNVWLVDSKATATKASRYSEEWYNAGYESPENRYAGNCKVVEVTLVY